MSAPGAPSSHSVSAFALAGFGATSRSPSNKYRGRAGRCSGPGALKFTQSAQTKSAQTHGPRRLATSRLVEVVLAFARRPQVRQSLGVPRAVFIGLLRIAPGGLTLSGFLPYGRTPIHRYLAQTVPSTSDRAGCRRQWGPRDARTARRDECGLDRRLGKTSAASPTPPNRPPLPAPRLETADPSAFGAGWMGI